MTETPIKLDHRNLLAQAVGDHGITAEEAANLPHRIRGMRSRLAMERKQGLHEYLALPGDDLMIEQVLRVAQPRMGRFESLILIGIGGSALGLRALVRALSPFGTPGPELFIIDNTDPALYAEVASRANLKRSLIVVVSKSGGTLESVIALGYFVERLREAKCDLREHLIVVTDPEKGPLRAFADKYDLDSLAIPPGVGGRFSVLTAAGLLPAALMSVDIAGLIGGAAAAERASWQGEPEADWPATLGLLVTDLCRKRGKHNVVFMPYTSRLDACADWFVQLWDESLGKSRALDGTAIEAGQTAVRAIGATDQHAQLQLFLEGPNDKAVVLLKIEKHEADVHAGKFEWADFDAAFVADKTLGQIINAQLDGTAQALAERKRPNATLTLPRLNSHGLGELMLGLELATSYAGFAWGINAYDQPGVELGKRLSRRILGVKT
ncbi:MAG: hypothetical protein IT462_08945 [Planctomycetes bacterium]|nr:hypothetical protein [Planctomycetota bacterium]